jgi:hypothetical protein
MIFHTHSHPCSVTPELAALLGSSRADRAGGLFSFWKKDPEGRLERHWYRRPD